MKPRLDPFRVRKNEWDIRSGIAVPSVVIEKPPEWHAWRRKGVGGSDAAAIMNACLWKTLQDVLKMKTGRGVPQPVTKAMRRGLYLEPVAREEYQQMTGVAMPSDRAIHPEFGFGRCNLDGINWEIKKPIEIKCPGWRDHRLALKGKIPDHYIWQCVHTLWVTGLEVMDYFSFDGRKGKIVTFERDLKLERRLVTREKYFWECVVNYLNLRREHAQAKSKK